MTTLQNAPQRDQFANDDFSPDRDVRPQKQSQQDANDQDRQVDRDQGAQETFTVSMDDWFKS